LKKISGIYHNLGEKKDPIPENLFRLQEDPERFSDPGTHVAAATLSLNDIDRHPLMNKFTIVLVYFFDDDESRRITTKYHFQVRLNHLVE
jgi:hypothetical protein